MLQTVYNTWVGSGRSALILTAPEWRLAPSYAKQTIGDAATLTPDFSLSVGQRQLHSTIKVNTSAISSCHVAFTKGLFSHPLLKWFQQVVEHQTVVQWVLPHILTFRHFLCWSTSLYADERCFNVSFLTSFSIGYTRPSFTKGKDNATTRCGRSSQSKNKG